MAPTRSIAEATTLIEEGVERFLLARKTLPQLGKYESHLEALNLFNFVIRHTEAICTLAKRDLVMLPSALPLARAALETTCKIIWMLHPTEVFDREARWLAYLAGEESYLRKTGNLLIECGQDGAPWIENANKTHQFRTSVERLLPPTTQPLKALPDFRSMLKEIGEEPRYLSYMRLSQFAHGTHAAGSLYRKNLGCGKVLGKFIYPESWAEPMKCCWWCLATGGTRILNVLGGQSREFMNESFLYKVTEALNKV